MALHIACGRSRAAQVIEAEALAILAHAACVDKGDARRQHLNDERAAEVQRYGGARHNACGIVPAMRIRAWSGRRLPFIALSIVIGAAVADAQAPISPSTRMASRADLERLVTSYEQLAASTAYGERTRAKARTEADAVRRRLRDGDFRVGDQILVRVDGPVSLDDTVTVVEGPRLMVRGIRTVELTGVLRSELATKVTVEVTEVVRTATVNVRPMSRVAVFGAVAQPGFIAVPPETTLDQLLSRAGGPTDNGRTDQIRVMRGSEVIMRAPEVMAAIAQGRTLDALDLREGDVLEVPRRDQGWQMQNTLQIVTLVISPVLTFLLVR